MAIGLRQRQAGAAAVRSDEGAAGRADTRPAGRGRVAAARGTTAAGSLLLGIARLIRLVVACVVVIIVAAIVLRVLGANTSNSIVSTIHDAAKWLVGPFDNIFSISNAKLSIAVNWGVAALVYLIVGGFIASLFARAGRRTAAAVTV